MRWPVTTVVGGTERGLSGPGLVRRPGRARAWLPAGVAVALVLTGGGVAAVAAIPDAGTRVFHLSGGSYGFLHPDAIAFDGSHVWIANLMATVTAVSG